MAAAFQADAFQNDAFQTSSTGFGLDAVLHVGQSGSFGLDAWIRTAFTLDAVIRRGTGTSGSSSLTQTANSGRVTSADTVYATARSGAGTLATTSNFVSGGQDLVGSTYTVFEGFLEFDTSAIPAAAEILSAVISIDVNSGYAGPAQNAEIRVNDYGSSLTTADFVPGANLSSLTLVATLASTSWPNSGLVAFTSQSAMLTSITQGGKSRFIFESSRLVAGTVPSGTTERFLAIGPGLGGLSKLVISWLTPLTFGLDAFIQPSFKLNAVISKGQSGSFSLDAIKAGGFTLNAVLRATISSSFALDAVVRAPNSFFLSAVIMAPVFVDLFDRVVAQGLGNAWVWTNWDAELFGPFAEQGPQDARAFVTGNWAQLNESAPGFPFFESYGGLPWISQGWIQFDFWVPDTTNINEVDTTYGVVSTQDEFIVGTSENIGLGGGGGAEWIATGWGHTGFYSFTPTPSSWYTVRFELGLGATDRVKVWPQGTAVPGTWQDIGTNTGGAYDKRGAYLDFYFTPDYEPAKVDNLIIWTIEYPWTQSSGFNLQAVIPPHFSLDAVLSRGFHFDAIRRRTMGDGTAGVTVVNSTGAAFSGSTGFSVSAPSGSQAGDLLIAAISFDALMDLNATVVVTSTGWTLLNRIVSPNGDQGLSVFGRRLQTGQTAGAVSFTTSPARDVAANYLVLRGAESIEVLAIANTVSDVLVHPTPLLSYDAALLDQTLLYFWSGAEPPTGSYGYGNGWLDPSPELTFIRSNNTTFANVLSAYEDVPVGGVLGTRQFSYTGLFGNDIPTQIQVLRAAPSGRFFGLDAVLGAKRIQLDAIKRETFRFPLDLDAFIAHTFRLDAILRLIHTFSLNAVIRRSQSASFSLDATFVPAGQRSVPLNAVLRKAGQSATFDLRAYVYYSATPETSFDVNAWIIGTVASLTLDAQISSPSTPSASFSLNAFLSTTYRLRNTTLAAILRVGQPAALGLDAVIQTPAPAAILKDHIDEAVDWYRSWTGDVTLTDGRITSGYTIDPGEPTPYAGHSPITPSQSAWAKFVLPVGAEISAVFDTDGSDYDTVLSVFVGDNFPATLVTGNDDFGDIGTGTQSLVQLDLTGPATYWFGITPFFVGESSFTQFSVRPPAKTGSFDLSAWIRTQFTLAAAIVNPNWQWTLNAVKRQTRIYGMFNLDAQIGTHSFTLAALVARTQVPPYFELVANIVRPSGAHTFSLDALFPAHFRLDAFVLPTFHLDAFIKTEVGVKIWPGPIDAGTGAPFVPPEKQAQIRILIDGVDWTDKVELNQMEFVQAARTSPGTFSLPIRGAWPQFDGGEEVIYEVDGYRQFGGFVRQPIQGHHFVDISGIPGSPVYQQQPLTTLVGVDFNALFDQIVIYNVPEAKGSAGTYKPIPALPKNTSDRDIIVKYWSTYIDAPWRKLIDFTAYVDEIASPNPETPYILQSGTSARGLMTDMSRMTNAVWYIDAYYNLHYHARSNVTAPFAISDGTEGVSCRNLTFTSSIAEMINDNIVYGVKANTVSGEIVYSRHFSQPQIDKYGLWQYIESRSDLHVPSHVQLRSSSIRLRREHVLDTAHCEIFERGFQAGQVATLTSHLYGGIQRDLVIRQERMTVMVSQEPAGGKFYGVPLYELDFGLEPDDPWDFYDMIPFENEDFRTSYPNFRFQMPHVQLWNQDGGQRAPAEPCQDDWFPGAQQVFRDDFDRMIVGNDWGNGWLTNTSGTLHQTPPIAAPPYCIIAGFTQPNGGVTLAGSNNDPNAPLPIDSSEIGNLSNAWTVSYNGINLSIQASSQLNSAISTSVSRAARSGTFSYFWMRVQVTPTYVRARVWDQTDVEPTWWLTANWPDNSGFGLTAPDRISINTGFVLPPPTGIAVSAAPGSGYAWKAQGDSGLHPDYYSPFRLQSWIWNFYPGGPLPPSYPHNPSAADGYVAVARAVAGAPPLPANDASSTSNTATRGIGASLLPLVSWEWAYTAIDSNAPFFGNGDGVVDGGAMIYDIRRHPAFVAPIGATRVHLTAKVAAVAPLTGDGIGLGGQPPHNDEGPIGWEVWRSDFKGDPASPRLVSLLGTGVLTDYNDWWTVPPHSNAFPSGYQTISVDMPITGGEVFQITGRITNTYGNMIATHNHGPFTLFVNGTNRNVDLSLYDVRLSFDWEPQPPVGDLGLIGGACDDTSPDPYWEVGWGSESRAVSRTTGVFTTRLAVTPHTLQVYDQGSFLIEDRDWVATDDTGLNFRLLRPGPRCVRVTYLAAANVADSTPSTRVETSAQLPADQMRLPDIRGLQ